MPNLNHPTSIRPSIAKVAGVAQITQLDCDTGYWERGSSILCRAGIDASQAWEVGGNYYVVVVLLQLLLV
jgi:hypothetical protein